MVNYDHLWSIMTNYCGICGVMESFNQWDISDILTFKPIRSDMILFSISRQTLLLFILFLSYIVLISDYLNIKKKISCKPFLGISISWEPPLQYFPLSSQFYLIIP